MPQCKETHPKSPYPDIYICVLEKGHSQDHNTYDANNKNYYWPVEKKNAS